MQRQVEAVRKFLYGWLVEGGPEGQLAPPRVASLYGLCFLAEDGSDWRRLQSLENAVEAWAIELNVGTCAVDGAHPDAPMGDNIVRKLMVIRGSGKA